MISAWRSGRLPRPFVPAAVAAMLIVCLTAIVLLSVDVHRKFKMLGTADSDRVQWTLSQVEVELLKLRHALVSVDGPGPLPLREVRRRFDIFYSRIDTLEDSPLFAGLRREPDVVMRLARVRDFLAQAARLVDGPDAELADASPMLEAQTALLLPELRQIALTGTQMLAAETEEDRRQVAATMSRVATLSVLLAGALLVLVAALVRMVRASRRQAEKTARTSARLETVIATSRDAILVLSRDGRVIDFNGAAERIFGRTRDAALDRPLHDFLRIPGESPVAAFVETPCRAPQPRRTTLSGLGPDGATFPAELSIASAQREDELIFVCFVRDISARLAAEQALVDARDRAVAGERAKARLLAVMSHEIRTPLNGILGMLDLLEPTELDDLQRRYLALMRSSGDLLMHHVNDVLELSRLDAGHIEIASEPLDLPALLQEVAESQRTIAEERGNDLQVGRVEPGLRDVCGDAGRLRQVLLNLVGNAVKFTQDGQIRIEAERVEPGREVVELRVADTGIGIPSDQRGRIFDDFVTLDTTYDRTTGGTGLGLGIVRRAVEAMGGEIGCESEPGEGSLFWVRLPLPPSDRNRPLAGPATGATPCAPPLPRDVLLVEDNPVNREVARAMLEQMGCTVAEAEDGAEGVAQAAARRFDLILMDISMPGLDGLAATRAIRLGGGPNGDTPVVALTAHALPDDLDRFEAAGLAGALVKPVSRERLRATLERGAAPRRAKTGAAGRDAPLVDPTVREALEADLPGERAARVLSAFRDEAAELVALLDVEAGENLAERAHRLAGSAAIVGATRLRRVALDLEAALRSDDRDARRALVADLPRVWDETRDALHQPVRRPVLATDDA